MDDRRVFIALTKALFLTIGNVLLMKADEILSSFCYAIAFRQKLGMASGKRIIKLEIFHSLAIRWQILYSSVLFAFCCCCCYVVYISGQHEITKKTT